MSLGLHCYRQTKDIQEKIAGLNSKISTRDTFCVVKIWKHETGTARATINICYQSALLL
jgi:hypothetical protein